MWPLNMPSEGHDALTQVTLSLRLKKIDSKTGRIIGMTTCLRAFCWHASAAIAFMAAILGPAHAQSDTGYLSPVEVMPKCPSLSTCIAALKAMSADTPSDSGNIGYDVLQQGDHANHFTVVEEWTDMKAVDAHAMAPHTRAFREQLIPIKGALFDERFYTALN